MPQHYRFAWSFYDSIMNGTLYPSWSDQVNNGYGDVGIRFYPPLTYYVLSLFRIISGNWYEATYLAIVFFFFIGGLGVYLWAREWFSENSSLIGALFYLVAPYHLLQIYLSSLMAEFAAASILPFCFLYATRVCQKGERINAYKLALSVSLLILTHLPTTIMAFVALSIYVLFSLRKTDFIQTIFKLSYSVLLAVLLSSFYWVRMVTELDWVNHNLERYNSGYFSYRSHFAFSRLSQLFGVDLGSSSNLFDILLLVTVGVFISTAILHFLDIREIKNRLITNVLMMTAVAILMNLPFSIFIWESFPIIQKIQFPSRWMIFISLGCAIFVAASFKVLVAYFKTSRRYLSILTIGLLVCCISFGAIRIVNNLFYIPKDFFTGMVERLKSGYSYDCWWTPWIPSGYSEELKMVTSKLKSFPAKVVIDNRNFEIKEWKATERNFVISAGNAGQAEMATMYYPHWKATVNGQPAEVTPSEAGFISFYVPAEKADVQISFQEPSHVITAYYISGFAWIIILGLLITNTFIQNKKKSKILNYGQHY